MPARFSTPSWQTLDSNGDVGSGWKLNFYEPGTTTRKNTYTTNALSVANANPVVADSSGRFGNVWITGSYKVVLTDDNDVTIWTADPVDGGDSVQDIVVTDLAGYAGGDITYFVSGYATSGDGGHGWWRWSSADLSAEVAADTKKGLYCARTGEDGSTGAWVRQFVGKIKIPWFGGNPSASALVNRQACQAAVNMASFLGGGEVFIPPGSHNWDVALPVIVPSNITISGLRGESIINADSSTIVDITTQVWPTANDGIFATGDPTTGNIAGERSGNAVNAAKIVTDVHFKDLVLTSDATGALAANYDLSGFYIVATRRFSVTGNYCTNLPGTGIRAVNMYDGLIDGNVCNSNGLWQPTGSRNGISAIGLLDDAAETSNSRAMVITNNVCNENGDVGIAMAMNKGCVCSNNVVIGNGSIQIEGDSSFATSETLVSLGWEVPTDIIISNNFVDARGGANTSGISWLAGNQGRIKICNNIIRNTVNSSALIVDQTNGGIAEVSDNLLDNCDPDTNFHQILISVSRATVTNNRIINPGSTGGGIVLLAPPICTSVVIKGNTIEAGCTNAVAVRPGDGLAVEFIDISDNFIGGSSLSAIIVAAAAAVNIKHLSVKNNTAVEVNTGASGSEGFLRINATLTITKLVVTGNDASYGGATTYPVFVNSGAGTIAYGRISDNEFGDATIPFAVGVTNDTAAFTLLYQNNNGTPGQRIIRGSATPVAGTYARGDIMLYIQPSASSFIGEVCTTGGTPGTWKTFGVTSA